MESSDSCGSKGQSTSSRGNFKSEEASSNGSETEGQDTAASPILNSCESIIII